MKEGQKCMQDTKRWFAGSTGNPTNMGRGGFRHTVIKNSQSSPIVDQKLKGNLPVKSCQNWHAWHCTPYEANPSSCTGNEWLEPRYCHGNFCRVGQMMLIDCGRRCGNWQRRPTASVKFTFPSPLRVPFAFHHCHGHAPKQVLFLSCTLRENSRVSCVAGPHSQNLRSHSLPKIKPFSLSAVLTW